MEAIPYRVTIRASHSSQSRPSAVSQELPTALQCENGHNERRINFSERPKAVFGSAELARTKLSFGQFGYYQAMPRTETRDVGPADL
jgi:hypothetical protein